jgi:hypothetical protein
MCSLAAFLLCFKWANKYFEIIIFDEWNNKDYDDKAEIFDRRIRKKDCRTA